MSSRLRAHARRGAPSVKRRSGARHDPGRYRRPTRAAGTVPGSAHCRLPGVASEMTVTRLPLLAITPFAPYPQARRSRVRREQRSHHRAGPTSLPDDRARGAQAAQLGAGLIWWHPGLRVARHAPGGPLIGRARRWSYSGKAALQPPLIEHPGNARSPPPPCAGASRRDDSALGVPWGALWRQDRYPVELGARWSVPSWRAASWRTGELLQLIRIRRN